MSEPTKTSLSWTVITGLVLTALPLSAVAKQSARLANGETLDLPAEIVVLQKDSLTPIMNLQTPLRQVNLSALTGDNAFASNQTAYLFLKRSGKTWYPYAILNTAPVLSTLPKDSIMIRAQVQDKKGDQLSLNFSFDRVSPPQSFVKARLAQQAQPIRIGLAVSEDGRTSVSAIYLGDQRFDQRVNLKSVLRGFKKKSAAPPPPT